MRGGSLVFAGFLYSVANIFGKAIDLRLFRRRLVIKQKEDGCF